jgi:hypothetical protein
MPLSITKLLLEILLEITRNVIFDDLRRLRSVNSVFNTLASPAVFSSITVYSDKESAETFFTLIHTPHIARHIESIDYVEGAVTRRRGAQGIQSSCQETGDEHWLAFQP